MKKLMGFLASFILYQPVFAESLQAIIARESINSGIVPELIEAVIKVESAGKRKAVSHKGAGGLMQLMPATAVRFGVTDVFNQAQNIKGGATYLAWLYKRYGNWPFALAGYNAGEGAVDKYGGIPPYKETQNYVVKVLEEYWRIKDKGKSFYESGKGVRKADNPVKYLAHKTNVNYTKKGLKEAIFSSTAVEWMPPKGYYD